MIMTLGRWPGVMINERGASVAYHGPVPDDVRAAVLDDLRATVGTPEGSFRKIGARHGVSGDTVRRIAIDAKIDVVAERRTKTKNAIEATTLSNAERRSRLAVRMLEEAERALDEMVLPHTVFNFGGKDNTFEARTLPVPPTGDKRNLMIIAATAIDKHKVLESYDTDAAGVAAVDRWLKDRLGQST